jgi:hypothetical protein
VSGALPWLVPLAVLAASALIVTLRGGATRAAVPLADTAALGVSARRLRAVRVAVALPLVVALALTVASVREPDDQYTSLLSDRENTVIVLDVSASVSELVYQEIARTLTGIVEAGGDERRIGLVVFSDVAVEALPPGTPVDELRPYIRFFLPKQEPGASRKPSYYRAAGPTASAPIPYPQNPWFRKFSGGTHISTGLAAARQALLREGGQGGRVVLLSDLAEARNDLGKLTSELVAYARDPALDLQVVALPPATEAELAVFELTLADPGAVRVSADFGKGGSSDEPLRGFPFWLAVLAAIGGLCLAVNELLQPLAWRRSTQEAM